jgi:hypothetical protein
MSLKTIQITIPEERNIPDILTSFSPEENYIMLKIGCQCLEEGRKSVIGFSQKEIYQKIRDETKDEISKLELDILVEREMSKKMGERISQIYDAQVDQMKKQNEKLEVVIQGLREQIKTYECENADFVKCEVDKVREKCTMLLQEKDNQNKLNREAVEKLQESVIKLTNKSTSHKGSEGEKTFSEYAETFIDFKGFNIVDKHTQAGEGDFHLHFEEFDVLADAKNYKKKVPVDQREKIKKDLLKNEHIHFGWLVSLNTSIDKFDKSPIMYEWINTRQCLVYINNLSSFEDPKKILRIVWYTCKELYKLIEHVDQDENGIPELKEKNFKLIDKIKNVRKTIREINTSMNTTRNLIQVMDDDLRVLLENETNEIVTSNISLFDDWWEQSIEVTNDETIVASTDLWTRFKHENKLIINEMNVSGEKFKQYIKSKVPSSCIILRNKNAISAFDIKGIQLKVFNYKSKIIENEKIDIELNEEIMKKQKMIKKTTEIVFSKELDSKLLNEYYSKKDIMEISEKNNIKPWQVASLLMKYKIIKKKDEALGYDKYKETTDYKQKFEKK